MELYTFILDYLGGTYISQVKSSNKFEAMKLWIQNLQIDEIENFSNNDKMNLIRDNFSDEDPIAISGLKNVWHFLITTSKGTGFVNFVKTKRT